MGGTCTVRVKISLVRFSAFAVGIRKPIISMFVHRFHTGARTCGRGLDTFAFFAFVILELASGRTVDHRRNGIFAMDTAHPSHRESPTLGGTLRYTNGMTKQTKGKVRWQTDLDLRKPYTQLVNTVGGFWPRGVFFPGYRSFFFVPSRQTQTKARL